MGMNDLIQEAISRTERVLEHELRDLEEALANFKKAAGDYNAMLVYAQDIQSNGVNLIRLATCLQTLEGTQIAFKTANGKEEEQ